MRAMTFSQYGLPSVLELSELALPVPRPREVLVEVYFSAVNDFDWSMVRGKPWLYRLMFGLWKPKQQVPGMEMSGVVRATGSEVSRFQVGDAVYGDLSDHGFGSFAEYVCLPEDAFRKKPPQMSFETAAALPHAALLAWQSFQQVPKIDDGHRILINGAGGGVGTLALQMIRYSDAKVHLTGVDAWEKLDQLRDLGFDEVLDYRAQDFTQLGQKYDFILDCKTHRLPWRYLKALKSGGYYMTVGGKLGSLLLLLIFRPFARVFHRKNLRLLAL
ncbi:MAG: NAD(P)-dependent alcohol dehydrogenase, partial [Bacteroidota bacterium]